jgi:hypothetical protein
MAKKKAPPPTERIILRINPISLTCPFCKARPNQDCSSSAGGFSRIHIARIQAASNRDAANKRKREDVNQAAFRIVREATED